MIRIENNDIPVSNKKKRSCLHMLFDFNINENSYQLIFFGILMLLIKPYYCNISDSIFRFNRMLECMRHKKRIIKIDLVRVIINKSEFRDFQHYDLN